MCKLLIYSMKRIIIVCHFSSFQALQISISETIASDSLYWVFALTAPSDSLYRVFTLTAKAYMETLLKDESPPNSPSDSLYRVLTLMTKAYTETPER